MNSFTPTTKANESLTTKVANKDDINLDKNDTNNNNSSDKLREGPCAGVFSNIEECAKTKGVELRNYKVYLFCCMFVCLFVYSFILLSIICVTTSHQSLVYVSCHAHMHDCDKY